MRPAYIIVFGLLYVGFVGSKKIECGYQWCNSSIEICKGTTKEQKRCHKCSDFIKDINKDCNLTSVLQGCTQYCIDEFQELFKLEQMKNRKIRIRESAIRQELKHQTHTSRLFLILFSVTLFLLVVMSILCIYAIKQKTAIRESHRNMVEDVESNTTDKETESRGNRDSGISEQDIELTLTNEKERDRLQQVKPKHDGNNTKIKVVPSGRKSTTDLSKPEEQSLLKEPDI